MSYGLTGGQLTFKSLLPTLLVHYKHTWPFFLFSLVCGLHCCGSADRLECNIGTLHLAVENGIIIKINGDAPLRPLFTTSFIQKWV